MYVPALATLLIEPVVRAALIEDFGRAGDITTDAIVSPDACVRTALVAREAGVLAGLETALLAFRLLDATIQMRVERPDGSALSPGEVIAEIAGPARAILGAERVALNFLCHLSGVASATAAVVDALRGYRTRVACTRKTMPGLRTLQKYAVRVGGGSNHRFGLDDAILIKDNHVALAGGIVPAIERARAAVGHLVKIEVEVDTLEQLAEAIEMRADAVLLDNMNLETLRQAVALVAARALTEASGRITPASARSIAACGVDLISIGWLTHSSPALDIGLDYRA